MLELEQDHCRTLVQVELLKRELDEHGLELRVKAANEAEAACQQRLAAAEAEIAEHRQRLDESERSYPSSGFPLLHHTFAYSRYICIHPRFNRVCCWTSYGLSSYFD